MKIIKFKGKVNHQYFINEKELINHLKNVVFKNEPEAKEVSDEFIMNESFDIGESEYVDADLEFLFGDHTEFEYWHEKLTDTVLDVPIEIIRHFEAAEICDSFKIKKPNTQNIKN